MTHLSLFSGIGGLDIAAEMAGFQTVGQCEAADYPTRILEQNWPEVSHDLLGRAVHQNRLLTSPTASDAVGTHGGGNSRSLRTDAGRQLNPTWVEWLMGYPAGWTELKPSETP